MAGHRAGGRDGPHALPGGPQVRLPPLIRVAGLVAVGAGGALIAVAALSLGRQFTIAVTPLPQAQLRTAGLYGLSRHPLYSGWLVASAGMTVVRGRASTAVAATVLAGVLHAKAGVEDQVLAERFGTEWQDYRARVPRLVGLRRAADREAPSRERA